MIRKLLLLLLVLALLAVAGFAVCVYLVGQAGKGRVFDQVDRLPAREAGLLLGVSEIRRNGTVNPYFQARIDAAAKLFRMGKIKRLLVSGDPHLYGRNQLEQMKRALIAAHVPAGAITVDNEGLRTLDSVVRAARVYGLRHFTIISQREHDQRALLIAKQYHIDAIAYAADDVAFQLARYAHIHEWLAQVKAVLDLYVFHTKPQHAGAAGTGY